MALETAAWRALTALPREPAATSGAVALRGGQALSPADFAAAPQLGTSTHSDATRTDDFESVADEHHIDWSPLRDRVYTVDDSGKLDDAQRGSLLDAT